MRDTFNAMPTALDYLLQSQNADGGWGYRIGGMSYIEPTSAALLAVRDTPNDFARYRARDFLLALQQKDGGWGIAQIDDESGWMTAWAVRALASFADLQIKIDRGVLWLIQTSGNVITDPKNRAKIREWYQMDSTLRGFPWQVGDAAWVHPTALAILALVAANQRDHARTRDAVAYLLDRATASGGWNIGNPQMIDKPIPATIQDTAMALLALRAVGVTQDDSRVSRALAYLVQALANARTTAELAFGLWAASEWQIAKSEWSARLNSLQRPDGSWDGNPFYTSVALLAQRAAGFSA